MFIFVVPRDCSTWHVQNNTDSWYNDIASVVGTTQAECFRWCIMTANCVAAAFGLLNTQCWIKTTINLSGENQKTILYCTQYNILRHRFFC